MLEVNKFIYTKKFDLSQRDLEGRLLSVQRLPRGADAARQLHELHVAAGGTDHLDGVAFHAGRLIEEGNDVHAISHEDQLQQAAHAQPIQAIDATAQARNGQFSDQMLTLRIRNGLAMSQVYVEQPELDYHMLAHGQQRIVERRIGALLVRPLLGHQVVDVASALLQHGDVARVPLLALQLVHLAIFAAKLQADPSAHGKVRAHRVHQSEVFRCAKQVALRLGYLTLGSGQLERQRQVNTHIHFPIRATHLSGDVVVLAYHYLDGIFAMGEDLLHYALHLLPLEALVAAADPRHRHFGDFMIPLRCVIDKMESD